MESARISVGWFSGIPERRYYLFEDKPGVKLKNQIDNLTPKLESIQGIEATNVIPDLDCIAITVRNRSWEDIEKDLADVFSKTLFITPRFVHRPSFPSL